MLKFRLKKKVDVAIKRLESSEPLSQSELDNLRRLLMRVSDDLSEKGSPPPRIREYLMNWSEENMHTEIGKLYWSTLGGRDEPSLDLLQKELSSIRPELKWLDAYEMSYELCHAWFRYRDGIGRILLDFMRRADKDPGWTERVKDA